MEYSAYYKYLSKHDMNYVKAQIAYYDEKVSKIITMSIIVLSIFMIAYTDKEVYKIIMMIQDNDYAIIYEESSNRLIWKFRYFAISINIFFTILPILTYRLYVNKRYKINIAKDYIDDNVK